MTNLDPGNGYYPKQDLADQIESLMRTRSGPQQQATNCDPSYPALQDTTARPAPVGPAYEGTRDTPPPLTHRLLERRLAQPDTQEHSLSKIVLGKLAVALFVAQVSTTAMYAGLYTTGQHTPLLNHWVKVPSSGSWIKDGLHNSEDELKSEGKFTWRKLT